MASPRDIQLVDDFVPVKKFLEGAPPQWTQAPRVHEIQAIWNVLEESGAARAHLRFRLSPASRREPSISVIFRNNPIWRLDIKPDDVCEGNPFGADALGLPPEVCGTHSHTWHGNRGYVLDSTIWDLPARRKVHAQVRRLPQALAFMAAELNIELTPEQRLFDIPPRRDLFEVE